MASKTERNIKATDSWSELEQLRAENEDLRRANAMAYSYIRDKVDQMLMVIGTKSLKPEELDDASLLEFDPIGIVSDSFQHVLDNLRETNSKLHFAHDEIQAIFDTVGAALLVLNPQQEIVAYNQKTEELLLEGQEALGQRCRDLICKGAPPPGCLFSRVLNSGREQYLSDWSTNNHDFNVVGRPMFDESGKVSHVVLAYSDVTARKSAESALLCSLAETREANSKIEGILRSVSDCFLVTDADDQIVLINRRAEELLGVHQFDKTKGCSIDNLSSVQLRKILKNAREMDDFYTEDLVFTGDGDESHVYQARVTVIRSSEGQFRGSIAFLHDVTEQREVDRMKSEFVSTAAHELRTPLATIVGYTDLLLNGGDEVKEQLDDFLVQIQQKAERLSEIVSDLLDISRIESGEALQMIPRVYAVEELCQQVLEGYSLISEKHQVAFALDSAQPIHISADRYAFFQILENILSNAIKYSPEGGEILINATADDGCCHLSIIDPGIGMTPDEIERIYEKFYRADAANTAISGTGLGMTIVKHLVEAQNGSVRIDSEPQRGTTVRVSFPLADAMH
ncbi:MAG: hypothetical protein C0623_12745 [Desulfuromonas sp.]|nr:MAG: hypothetical protein C0623_12745 [Desulfuromonas sp.]